MRKILLLIFLITTSCANNKVVNNHGLSALELRQEKIEISKNNKNDIINLIWFYIERKKVNQSILKLGKSKIEANNVLEIIFDNYGIVKEKKFYTLKDMNDLKIVKEITGKKYDSNSYFGKVLTSVKQKIEAPKNKKK